MSRTAEDIINRHFVRWGDRDGPFCNECKQDWPCDAIGLAKGSVALARELNAERARTAAPVAGGLDVARLADACRNLSLADMFNLGEPFEQVAADIAREYGRPRRQPARSGGGGMSVTTRACEFVPAHEPWTCRIHDGVRTSLDQEQCDIARPAEPFNDAYLDNIREAIAEGRNPASRYIVRRLLATIDAERLASAPSQPVAEEGG